MPLGRIMASSNKQLYYSTFTRRARWSRLNQGVEKQCSQAGQKGPDARPARNRPFDGVYPERCRRTQDRPGGGVLMSFVGIKMSASIKPTNLKSQQQPS